VYDIIEGKSNGNEFVQFFARVGVPHIQEGNIVAGDNLSYHYRGPAAEAVVAMVHEKGARYIMQPKYSPEVNPSEFVFSFLKQQLRDRYSIYDDLLMAMIDILDSISINMMIGWYKRTGWL